MQQSRGSMFGNLELLVLQNYSYESDPGKCLAGREFLQKLCEAACHKDEMRTQIGIKMEEIVRKLIQIFWPMSIDYVLTSLGNFYQKYGLRFPSYESGIQDQPMYSQKIWFLFSQEGLHIELRFLLKDIISKVETEVQKPENMVDSIHQQNCQEQKLPSERMANIQKCRISFILNERRTVREIERSVLKQLK